MAINLYYLHVSSPCRSVMLAAKALGVELNLKKVDVTQGEHLTPEFIKINPQHTIPTLDDNGFIVSESRAILGYLADQYGKDDSLYPKDAKKRAIVNQRLYFDMGTLYQRFADYFYPLFKGIPLDDAKKTKVEEALQMTDKFLENNKYFAGDQMTIADFSVIATISTIEAVGFDMSVYANLNKWYKNAKSSIPGYKEINEKGLEVMKAHVDKLRK